MPTKAIWDGKECDVRVDTDLEANWSVSILSGEFDPVSLIRRPAAPLTFSCVLARDGEVSRRGVVEAHVGNGRRRGREVARL